MSDLFDTAEKEVSDIPTRGSKRKALILDKNIVTPSALVEPLLIQKLVLTSEKGKAHFQRLNYFGCPTLRTNGTLNPKLDNVYMGREAFARAMYRLFQPHFNATRKTNFDGLTKYVRYLDENQLAPINGDYFHPELVSAYMTHLGEQVTKGASKVGWLSAKKTLSFILKQLNRTVEARNLPSIRGVKRETKKTEGLVETDLKPLVNAWYRAFTAFEQCFRAGSAPNIHPLWDEQLFERQAQLKCWSRQKKTSNKQAFIFSVSSTTGANSEFTWINQFSRLAAMIIFAFTGQNTTPLLNLRHSDVKFESKQVGKIYLNMEKSRAKYLSIDTEIGFSPFARRLIKTWLDISAEIQKNSNTDWVFPFIRPDGTIISFIASGRAQLSKTINLLTKFLGFAHATPRILRQTKIDILMKVTEDLFLVSLSANNEVGTLQASYSHGLRQDHERNLSASTTAMFDIAKGKNVDDAITEAKFVFRDVLSEYDYKKLKKGELNPHESQTPLGVHCMDNTKGAAHIIQKNMKKSGIDIEDKESFCTDFLACFECPYHKLVASVEDIWLMLSFRDTLTEMEQYPTVNSLPRERYHTLSQTIDLILGRFNEVSAENYMIALEKHKSAQHPLYASIYSLNDLLEVFA